MRPTYLEVNLPQLRRNVEAIRKHVASPKVMRMIKANAYGHGVDGVAPFLEPYVDYFGVAVLEEGIALRNMGIQKPILVAGGVLPEQVSLFAEYDLILTDSSMELLDVAEEESRSAGKRIKTHLKIDTGMERVGIHEYEAEPFIEYALKLKHVEVEGIYTHLANSKMRILSMRACNWSAFRKYCIYMKEEASLVRHCGIWRIRRRYYNSLKVILIWFAPGS